MFNRTNRRDFLRITTLFGAGAMLYGRVPVFAAGSSAGGAIGELTSLALVDDMLHLAGSAANLAPALEKSLTFGIDVFDPLPGNAAFFGRWMPAQPGDIMRLATSARQVGMDRDDDERQELKLALVAGWLVQRAGTDVIGPSLSGASDIEDASAYQDAAVLRARSAISADAASPEELASLFKQMVPRSLTRFHTLVPDYDDGAGWVVRLQQWRPDHFAKLERYAALVADTSSPTHRRFVAESNFYAADDSIVRLADQVRRGTGGSEADLQAAISGSNASLYGKALAQGMRQVLAVSAYLDGSLDASGFEDRLAKA